MRISSRLAGLAITAALITAPLITAPLVVARSAAAAPNWTAGTDIAGSDTGGFGQLTVASDGTTTAVWASIAHGPSKVQASIKPPGGVFAPPVDLPSTHFQSELRATVDDAGTVTAAWRESTGASPVVRVSRRPAGGTFSPPQDISDAGSNSDQLELDSAGATTVVTWRQGDRTRAAIASGAGGFATQNPLSVNGEKVDFPEVSVAPSGAAVIAWRRYDANGFTLRAAARRPGEAFGPLGDVLKTATKDDVMFGIRMATSPGGRTTLGFQRGIKGSNGLSTYTIWATARGTSGDFGPIGSVQSTPRPYPPNFSLAVSSDDTAAIGVPGPDGVRVAVRPSGSGFGQLQLVPGSGASTEVDVGFTSGEQMLAIWHQTTPPSSIMAADGASGAGFGAARQISAPGVDVVIHSHRSGFGVDDEGSAMAWWVRAVPIPGDPNALPIWRMQGAPYDVVAPTVNVSVPTTARVGQDVIMRATARDRWTGATVTWDFGDGGTEEGETLMYAYAEPGSYVVRITATDGAGNTRSATRQITVTSGGTRP